MSEIGVGKEILSHCNKCKLTLAHIIVTMKSLTVADKVMCKTCKGTHAFKDPSSASKPKSAVAKVLAKKSLTPKKSNRPIEEVWSETMNKINKPTKEYSIKGIFEVGDIVAHPNFGPGVVEKVIDSSKIEVLFRDDYRILIHRK
jgi:hypothetical protein